MSPPWKKRKKKSSRPGRQAKKQITPKSREGGVPPVERARRPRAGNVVSLDPLAPIIVRSGRPVDGRSDADPARFPPPSTTAGCLRTSWARENNKPFGPKLATLAVSGPLLLTRAGEVLARKPADALYFGHGESARCLRAEPRPFDAGCDADLPDRLLPVQLTEHVAGKPGDGPAWWLWKDLLAFRQGELASHAELCKNGWTPPRGDRRTHVAIDPDTHAADAGRLFQTEGLDLDTPDRFDGSSAGGLRLLVRCEEALGAALVHLGGKRRLAALQPEDEQTWPRPPQGWLNRIEKAGGLCLTLLTPGIFAAGYRPGWLDPTNLTGCPPTAPQLQLELRAAAVDRWEPHSGWDLAKGQPRPSRKLAGAGAVYWFRILGAAAPNSLEALWLNSVCDGEQDRRDGFGLALPSAWTPPHPA